MPLTIDVVSDVVCPWCFIGKRRLERALELYAEAHPGSPAPEVTWRPFQLNPWLPVEGMSRQDYVQKKFGAQGGAVYTRVSGVGAEVGIAFAFDRIVRQPNTVAAHSLVDLAHARGRQNEMVEALFRAYFLDGADLTSREALLGVATSVGLDRDEAASWLDNAEARATVTQNDERARAIGIEGVPFFIFNGKIAVSGAHPAETLLEAMRQAEA
jgi:predicted DsbA family dithiol-disulfide isomerase